MAGFVVMNIQKSKGQSATLDAHILRIKGKENLYKNADPSRLNLNKILINKNVDDIISKGYKGKTAVRKDAVRRVNIVLTGSHKEMKSIEQDKAIVKLPYDNGKLLQMNYLDHWINKNYEWACKEFGKKNIAKFIVHLDEKTPHIHLAIVPLTEDGRLSAKEVVGDKDKFKKRLTRYAEQMKAFGLERGKEMTKAPQKTIQHYTNIQKDVDNVEKMTPNELIEEIEVNGSEKAKTVLKGLNLAILENKRIQELKKLQSKKIANTGAEKPKKRSPKL